MTDVLKGRGALIVGHPGHELRVYQWLRLAQPTVFVLTDGSGSGMAGRIDSTSRILFETGCAPGPIYGCFTDKTVYQAIMEQQAENLIRLTEEFVRIFEKQRIEFVVGDAYEGYNPTHDLCRVIIGVACEIVSRRRGQVLPVYDFPLTGPPGRGFDPATDVQIQLDDAEFRRKIDAAKEYSELSAELSQVSIEVGLNEFRSEFLRVAGARPGLSDPSQTPFYETYGEKQVSRGRFREVLRFKQHFQPLAKALWDHAAAGNLSLATFEPA